MSTEETADIYMIDDAGKLLRKGEHIGNLVENEIRLLPDKKNYQAAVTRWVRENADKEEAGPQKPVETATAKKLTPADQEEADNKGMAAEAIEEAKKSRAAHQDDLAFARANNTPEPPKKNPQFGDKTPAYVDWLQRYRPEVFASRYGVKKKGKVPIIKTNPETNIDEVVGYRDADMAARKTHLTEKLETNRDLAEDMDWNA